ncbi:hypothetical protein FP2506_11262 [Fulvimarina pelagi HTCC2506]|uniref:Phage head-tail adaptor n=1 Tax=Fulvimarina pelagi HTCC2506 TaxID=314231 RepID=Q0FZ27_9HYPH|nr:phage head closure protein [Fulvimarina pelagi]EAU40131.1 hypothetical protein FP2506_11262 [Fulvimarina pelagi HTCC2506]
MTAKRLFIDPGLLRELAVLERPSETPDGMGGALIEWVAVGSVSIHIEPVSARRFERFDQAQGETRLRVLCRTAETIVRGRRFRIGERRLFIEAVYDPDESGRYLLCLCREEAQ